jgi:predicted regulator of Ras-like GTPase activity (Roadblock/LC7/MglB family)
VIAVLEPLARMPGVEFVLLISHDGVPIAHVKGSVDLPHEESLAALAAAWLNDIGQAVAPLGWHAPERACLRAARGTLVLRRSESACLVVCLGREASPEDVRLSMDGTLARIERARHGRANPDRAHAPSEPALQPPAPIPYRQGSTPAEEGLNPASRPRHSPGD